MVGISVGWRWNKRGTAVTLVLAQVGAKIAVDDVVHPEATEAQHRRPSDISIRLEVDVGRIRMARTHGIGKWCTLS
jgi:hypothetical protein